MNFSKKSKLNVAIPTTAMPDIIFMLLIFFMVATVFKQYAGLQVRLPSAEMVQKPPVSKRHIVTVWVNTNKEVVCDDYTVKDIKNLRNVVYQKIVKNPQIQIALKIDENANMGFVNKVHQELRKANALKVHYFARPGAGGRG
ncbi:MAG: biopolymer transporter ExbD [Calditrichaceae bacterium]|jgi:biopolymer transport protein ExbD